MTELEKIAYAKTFIDKLANGINPIDESMIPDTDIVNNVRLSRCFFYVSDILRQVIENGGITPPDQVPDQVKEKKSKKQPYSLSPEQAAQFEYSEKPITVTEIINRIIAAGPKEGVKKFPRNNLTKWLMSIGLLEEITLSQGKHKRPTASGREIGISEEERQGQYGKYYTVLYSSAAQHFIIDNIEAVIAFGNEEPASDSVEPYNQGSPWSYEDNQTLIDMFEKGKSYTEIATSLKRTENAIRSRLRSFGLLDDNLV